MHRQLAEVSKGADGLDDASVPRGRGKMCRLGQVYAHAVKVRARRENVHEKANFAIGCLLVVGLGSPDNLNGTNVRGASGGIGKKEGMKLVYQCPFGETNGRD